MSRVPQPANEHVEFRHGGRQMVVQDDQRRSIFGLTPTEARLAVSLAVGHSLEPIAHEHKISLATARNQLKAVFFKTNTHKQSELVALLLRL